MVAVGEADFIGVGFPVVTPSTITCAPVGKDVTFNVPAVAPVTPPANSTRRAMIVVKVARVETLCICPPLSEVHPLTRDRASAGMNGSRLEPCGLPLARA